mmetsp:Transcript_6554/g.9548  ORF Transcript_6554/g.9548 Transcript_6554/m.9548 type:complete len:262 (-) Transcript_6554:534-1319(-)
MAPGMQRGSRRNSARRRSNPPHEKRTQHDRLETTGLPTSHIANRMERRICTVSTISGMGTEEEHDHVGISAYLLLGVGTSHVGKVRGCELCGSVGVFCDEGEDTAGVWKTNGGFVCHGWRTRSGRMVDGEKRPRRGSTRRLPRNPRLALPPRGSSIHGVLHLRPPPLDRIGPAPLSQHQSKPMSTNHPIPPRFHVQANATTRQEATRWCHSNHGTHRRNRGKRSVRGRKRRGKCVQHLPQNARSVDSLRRYGRSSTIPSIP